MDTDNPSPEPANQTTVSGDHIARDKHIHGDQVHGDKVMGDKITYQMALGPRPPLQRPPRAEHFVDRETAFAQLLADLQSGREITICGPGGIGKTALAAEAVWQLAPADQPPDCFPDGVLYHSFHNQPQAALALEHIARSFDEEPKPTPADAAQRALAGRRVLLILDGAEQADNLQLVLNIRDESGVLITSRRREDVVDKRQDLLPLPPGDAVHLLQAWGGVRADDETAVRRISIVVGRLPLALCLVGRYLAKTEENAADYLAWLEQTPLAALDQGAHSDESIPLLLAHSIAQLSEQARQVLGVVGVSALAPLAWEPIAEALALSAIEARRALGELVNYGLLLRPQEAYEVTHALIHTYARLQLSPSTAVVSRLSAYYTTFLNGHPNKFDLLHSARPHIIALLPICRERQEWTAAIDLASAVEGYLELQGYYTDRLQAVECALAAAQALHDRHSEVAWLDKLGDVYGSLGQGGQAVEHYRQALIIAQELGDRKYEALWLGTLGHTSKDRGQLEQAIAYFKQALAIAEEIGDQHSEGSLLSYLGIAYLDLGQPQQAIAFFDPALALAQEVGDRGTEANAFGTLGIAYHDLGQTQQAIACYQQALAIAQEIGSRRNEGAWLACLGLASVDLGNQAQAIAYYQQAMAIIQDVHNRRGEAADLDSLDPVYRNAGFQKHTRQVLEQAARIFEEINSPYADTVRKWLDSLDGLPPKG